MRVNSRSVRGGMREGGIVGRYRPSEMDFQQASYAYGDEAAKMPQLCTVVWGFGVTPVEGAELVSALICASSKGVTIRENRAILPTEGLRLYLIRWSIGDPPPCKMKAPITRDRGG